MKISSVSLMQAFGKQPLMTCSVKDTLTNKNQNATLYKLDVNSSSDYKDIMYSKHAKAISDSFTKAFWDGSCKYRDFYTLQNDKTGEVISCASTSNHYKSPESINPGLSTSIDEFGINDKYVNAAEPMLAYIVKNAFDRSHRSVYAFYDQSKMPAELKRAKFERTDIEGVTYLPERRFSSFLNDAELRSQIEFLA